MESIQIQKSNILYISNFPKKINRTQLQKLLTQSGPLISLNIIQKKQFSFAFAQFDDIRDAAFAVKELNQKNFHGMNLNVQFRNKRLKAKQIDRYSEQKTKIIDAKIANSPHSNLETNCNLAAPGSPERSRQEDKNLLRFGKNGEKIKSCRQNSSKDISDSVSVQRSRQKNRHSRVDRNGRSKKGGEEKYGYSESLRQVKRCRQRKSQQGQVQEMLEMITYLGSSVRRLQQKQRGSLHRN